MEMDSFEPLNVTPDPGLLQVSQVDVFNSNSIREVVPYLKSVLFGDFENVFTNSSPEMQFRLLQLTQLVAEYFYLQTQRDQSRAPPVAVQGAAEKANYENLLRAYDELKRENEKLRKQLITPQYYTNMIAIKRANEQIRAENFKLKQYIMRKQQSAEFKCAACGKYFASELFLEKHAERRHQSVAESLQSGLDAKEPDTAAERTAIEESNLQMVSSDEKPDVFEPITVSRIQSANTREKAIAEASQTRNDATISVEARPKQVPVNPAPSVQTEEQKTLLDAENVAESPEKDIIKLLEEFTAMYNNVGELQQTEEANSIGEII